MLINSVTVTVIQISKNSGSLLTKAKINAAINLSIDIFMIARPELEKAKEFVLIKEIISLVENGDGDIKK